MVTLASLWLVKITNNPLFLTSSLTMLISGWFHSDEAKRSQHSAKLKHWDVMRPKIFDIKVTQSLLRPNNISITNKKQTHKQTTTAKTREDRFWMHALVGAGILFLFLFVLLFLIDCPEQHFFCTDDKKTERRHVVPFPLWSYYSKQRLKASYFHVTRQPYVNKTIIIIQCLQLTTQPVITGFRPRLCSRFPFFTLLIFGDQISN